MFVPGLSYVATRVLPESRPLPITSLMYFPRCFFCAARKANGEKPRPVSAIMVLHDPLDWALEVQVVVDVLHGGDVVSLRIYTAAKKRSPQSNQCPSRGSALLFYEQCCDRVNIFYSHGVSTCEIPIPCNCLSGLAYFGLFFVGVGGWVG